MKNTKFLLMLSGLFILTLIFEVIGCADKSLETGVVPQSIKIGGAIPLTGSYASGGVDLKWGYEQAVKDINAQGGIYVAEYKKKILLEIVLIDDESDSTKTVSRLEKLASLDKVITYVGTYSSELNAAAAGIAEKNGIPIVAEAFSNLSPHKQGYKYLFSPFVKTDEGVEAIFTVLNNLGNKRPNRLAIWAEQTDWGVELKQYVVLGAKKYGYQVVTNLSYDATTLDFSSLITASKNAGAEVPIAVPTPPTGIIMVKQMKQLDYNPLTYVFWRGASTNSWPKTLGKDGDYALYVSNWESHYPYSDSKQLTQTYQSAQGKLPSVTIGYGYCIIQVIADAITRAGSLNPAKIRDAIASTKNLMTVQGRIEKFREDGVGVNPGAILQWQDQISQVVYHPDFISAPFLYPMKKWSER
jgi:branched-chain amino acid transport system substrate-binding protein